MDIRLKITGGFGGPAAWQDITLDPKTVPPEELAKIESTLDTSATEQAKSSNDGSPPFPDAQTYEFELVEKGSARILTVTDASISQELRDIVQLMRRQAKGTNDETPGEKTS